MTRTQLPICVHHVSSVNDWRFYEPRASVAAGRQHVCDFKGLEGSFTAGTCRFLVVVPFVPPFAHGAPLRRRAKMFAFGVQKRTHACQLWRAVYNDGVYMCTRWIVSLFFFTYFFPRLYNSGLIFAKNFLFSPTHDIDLHVWNVLIVKPETIVL